MTSGSAAGGELTMITRILILMLAFGIFFTAFADPADAQRRKMRTAAEIVEYLDLNLDGEVDREEFVKGDRIFSISSTPTIIIP